MVDYQRAFKVKYPYVELCIWHLMQSRCFEDTALTFDLSQVLTLDLVFLHFPLSVNHKMTDGVDSNQVQGQAVLMQMQLNEVDETFTLRISIFLT